MFEYQVIMYSSFFIFLDDGNAFKRLIKSSMSLAGVESTVISPHLASHALLTQEERDAVGISDQLIRFSVGIEEVKDLKHDINQAIDSIS